MSGNGHLSPAQVHAKVKHPIIDADGHWVEFPPVFAEKMRKVGGDKAADGFLAPRGAGEGLKMTPAERTERRIAQPNFWNRQGEKTPKMPRRFEKRARSGAACFECALRTRSSPQATSDIGDDCARTPRRRCVLAVQIRSS